MNRATLVKWRNHVTTRENMMLEPERMVRLTNALEGPQIKFDKDRRGFGLFAERDYKEGEKVTEYGGIISLGEQAGDYVAKMGDVHVNGEYGFVLGKEQGRWINEFDRERSFVNVELGRTVKTTRPVNAGEQFFGDYGNEYNRENY